MQDITFLIRGFSKTSPKYLKWQKINRLTFLNLPSNAIVLTKCSRLTPNTRYIQALNNHLMSQTTQREKN